VIKRKLAGVCGVIFGLVKKSGAPIGAVKCVVNYFTGSNACLSGHERRINPLCYPVKTKVRVPFSQSPENICSIARTYS
jgi:hypothetical protein